MFLEETGRPVAIKIVKTDEFYQPLFMRLFPDTFVEIISIEPYGDDLRYIMPKHDVPDLVRDGEAVILDGLQLLSKTLWTVKPNDTVPAYWRALLHGHLHEQIKKYDLKLYPENVSRWVMNLPEATESPRATHGDATLANMVYDRDNGWLWIDPLLRPYIPLDPRVDLGKALQTAWGYERVILGLQEEPLLNDRLALDIVRRSGCSLDDAMKWCVIHLIRLLPYQTLPVRRKFEALLRNRFQL